MSIVYCASLALPTTQVDVRTNSASTATSYQKYSHITFKYLENLVLIKTHNHLTVLTTSNNLTTLKHQSSTAKMALVVAKNPSASEHRRKLLFDPNADHVTDIDAAVAVTAAAHCCDWTRCHCQYCDMLTAECRWPCPRYTSTNTGDVLWFWAIFHSSFVIGPFVARTFLTLNYPRLIETNFFSFFRSPDFHSTQLLTVAGIRDTSFSMEGNRISTESGAANATCLQLHGWSPTDYT